MIISTDTTWGSGQTYNLNEEVQVASGATLTIEAGAKVIGGTIRVFGSLNATGIAGSKIDFQNTNFLFGSDYKTPGSMHIEHANIVGGSFLSATGNASYGAFDLQDNFLDGVKGFYLWYPTSDSTIERNVFIRSSGLSIGVSNVPMNIENNVFYPTTSTYNGSSSIVVWASYGDPNQILVTKNSFLGGGKAIEVSDGYTSSSVFAELNYFETSDPSQIAARILDRSDSLTRATYIGSSFTDGPDGMTPIHVVPPIVIEPTPGFIEGTNANDVISGTGSQDAISGLRGDDVIYGLAGNDALDGGRGADILIGGKGQDTLIGGVGNDTASYATAQSRVVVSLERPSMNTGDAEGDFYISIESLIGSRFSDHLSGDSLANRLEGGKGNDKLDGGFGKDKLVGGLGADILESGFNADAFVYMSVRDSTVSRAGRDTILDFSHFFKDRIDLSQIDADSKHGGNQAFKFIGVDVFHGVAGELRFEHKAGDTYVYADVNGDKKADFSILLDGVTAVVKGDFLL